MILDRLISIVIAAGTAVSVALCFRAEGKWSLKAGLSALRFSH